MTRTNPLMAKAWRYWTKDFWRDFIALKDPLVKFNGTMMREIVRRLIMPGTALSRAKPPFE